MIQTKTVFANQTHRYDQAVFFLFGTEKEIIELPTGTELGNYYVLNEFTGERVKSQFTLKLFGLDISGKI